MGLSIWARRLARRGRELVLSGVGPGVLCRVPVLPV